MPMVDHLPMVDSLPMVEPILIVDPILVLDLNTQCYHPHVVLSNCLRRGSIELFSLV